MIIKYSGIAIDVANLEEITNDNRVIFKSVSHRSFVFDEAMDPACEWWVKVWQDYQDTLLTEYKITTNERQLQ